MSLKMKTKPEKAVFIIVFCIFFVYALVLLYPFFYAFINSLKESSAKYLEDTTNFPSPLYFSNYLKAFEELEVEDNTFLEMVFNTIWFAAGCTLCEIFSSSMIAYCVCRYKFKLRGFFYGLSVFVMIIPIYGALPSSYRIMSLLGLIDSRLYVLSAINGFGFSFIILYAYYKGVPWSYAEAAFIDGASHYTVFFRIMQPMAMPSVTAIGIMSFVNMWNDYSGPLLFMPSMPTLASGLYLYEIEMQYEANLPVYFAGTLVSIIPVITLFLIFQNTIMSSVYAGGLKG